MRDEILDSPAASAPILVNARGSAADTAERGPAGQILFDAVSGCSTLRSFAAAPTAILDDMSLVPGPAANAGAVISGVDFYVRTWGPRERIYVRLSFYDRINLAGEGVPRIVQHELVSQQFLLIENSAANLAQPSGSYLIVATLSPFVLHGPEFGLEIAYVDDRGEILPNGGLSTVFPGNACVATQPVIGSSRDVFWIDNDYGNLTGDGVRYEPADPSMPGDQGDALAWGGASPADNVLSVRIRGWPIEPTLGACCMMAEPFGCTLQTGTACAALSGRFIGLGEPCTPVFLCVPPPANDLCEQATAIAGEGQFAFDTRGASSVGPDDCNVPSPPFGISSDVWFRWIAPCTGMFQMATCGNSVTDDRLAVYSGNCGSLAILGCDDDSCPVGFQSWLAFGATAGRTYFLRVGAYPNTPGGQGALGIARLDGNCIPECVADFDGNGEVDVVDIMRFLSLWFVQDPRAWYFGGSEGGVPAIFAFLSAWFGHGIGRC